MTHHPLPNKYNGFVTTTYKFLFQASEAWTQQNHGDKKHWQDMPNYAILVDIRDRPSSQVTYVPEENIELITNTKIVHSTLEEYFGEFDGARYLPRPWLKKVYPHG